MGRRQGARGSGPADGLGEGLSKVFENALGDERGRLGAIDLDQSPLHGGPQVGVVQQGQHLRLESLRIGVGLGKQYGRSASGQRVGIVELVIVLGCRQRDQD